MAKDIIPGEGPKPCLGMIVGEAPGAEEERQGRPFVGKSGEELNKALAAADWPREWVYITNIYKLRPPGNRNPTEKEIASHAMLFHRELRDVQPRYILTLGNVPTQELLNTTTGITRLRGEWQRLDRHRVVLPTFHPSYVARGKGEAEFHADVSEFVRALRS